MNRGNGLWPLSLGGRAAGDIDGAFGITLKQRVEKTDDFMVRCSEYLA
jgi:hypothetical protein